MTLAQRAARKSLVFPIIYGWYRDASEQDMIEWRTIAADFISGRRDNVPLTLEDFRALQRELSHPKPDPGPECHGRAYLDDCPSCVAYWQDG